MSRGKAWRRHKDFSKARRKRNIDLDSYWYSPNQPRAERGWYKNLHQYSKNKIHCSCPMCSAKTRNKGRHKKRARGWAPAVNYTLADLRRVQAMDEDINTYFKEKE